MEAFEEHTIENHISAEKRAQVQLSSPRVTTDKVVKRPPDASRGLFTEFPSILLWTVLIMAATAIMLAARLSNAPGIWPAMQDTITSVFNRGTGSSADASNVTINEALASDSASEEAPAGGIDPTRSALGEDESAVTNVEPAAGDSNLDNSVPVERVIVGTESLQLLLENNFTRPNLPLAQDAQENMWLMGFVPNGNLYRIRVFPGYAAWSTLGVELTPPFRVETSVVIAPESPQGYAGLLGRYQDESNFYLFTIDGSDQSQLQLHRQGEWVTLTEWLPIYAVQPAGNENILAIEDDGEFLRFYVNGAPIHEITPLLPPGSVGLAGGTRDQNPAESNFQWIRIYGKP